MRNRVIAFLAASALASFSLQRKRIVSNTVNDVLKFVLPDPF